MCTLLNCTFSIPVLCILFFFLLNYTEVVSENVHLVKYLHFSMEAYCCHTLEIEKDQQGMIWVACLDAFKVLELVSLKPSVHLQLIK